MPLKAGSLSGTGYADSMASAMEDAFKNEWPAVMGDIALPASNDQMKLMFIAIAQGVITHLQQHCDAFTISITNGNAVGSTGNVTGISAI
jgi:2C-methyl-D-erythritol 2,4-cyclodiphosphate synthase